MKKVLVTGGAGFIGTNLCKKLLRLGYKVVAVDNFITSSGSNLQLFSGDPRFTFIKHDITVPFSKEQLSQLKTVRFIFHLACPTGVPNLVKLAEEMLLTCSVGTRNVLQLARRLHAKILLTSSSEVYGDPKEFPQDESYTGNVDPLGIRSPYEEGKRFAESLLSMYVKKYGINGKIVRVFNTYGPYMSRNDSRVIPTFLRQIKNNQPLTVFGNGLQTRTFCYVDDLVAGLMLVMEKGRQGEVYNLGSDEEIRIIDLANLLKNRIKKNAKIQFIKRPAHDHERRLASLQKIKKLGWQPKTSLEKGIGKALRW